jgi:Fe-S-cluster containining protein
MPPNLCQNCCACCQFCGEPPFATQAEYDNLPNDLRNELDTHYAGIVANGLFSRGVLKLPCLWLDVENQLCLHYDYRPLICSNFEIGGTDCQYFINRSEGQS